MFSKYNEISNLFKRFIEDALSKSDSIDITTLNDELKENYHCLLSQNDILYIKQKIDSAKKARTDYRSGVENQFNAVTDWGNALEKAKQNAISKEGEARNVAYQLANKVCITIYKGPLTLDTMRELKEAGYDGTYGSTTMMQMFTLYLENQRLSEQSKMDKAALEKKDLDLNTFEQRYREQFMLLKEEQTKKESLIQENETLKHTTNVLEKKINDQSVLLQHLNEKVDHLSKTIPSQLLEMMKKMFHQPTNQDIQVEEKTMQ